MLDMKLPDYKLGHLEDVAHIYTAHGFSKISDKKEVSHYIYCSKFYEPTMKLAMVSQETSFAEGFVITPKDGCNIMFLVAILDSTPGRIYLSAGNLKRRKAITMKALSSLPIRLISDTLQSGIAYLYYLVLCVKEMILSGSDDRNLQFRKEFYQEVLDDIALEILIPEIFEENHIGILSEWLEVIGTCCKGNKDISMEQLQEEIGNYVLQPGNKLTNSVKLFRFINDEIEKQFEKHEMENK